MTQKSKFSYVLLVATCKYKESLVDQVNKLYDVPCLIVIVVNGNDSIIVFDKYKQADIPQNCTIIHSPLKGKSNALNFFLSTISDSDLFIIFTDDDVSFPKSTVFKYIDNVEKFGKGFYYGGGVDVLIKEPLNKDLIKYYPNSIKGLSEDSLIEEKKFLGCNWGAFAEDLIRAGCFNPLFGPGSITQATGQEKSMMESLVRLGVKPLPIYGARVKHIAPDGCWKPEWLLYRRFRKGVRNGLKNYKMLMVLIPLMLIRIIASRAWDRRLKIEELKGMLHSIMFIRRKLMSKLLKTDMCL